MEQSSLRYFEYIDFCKVFAMFLVTWAHCAQQLNGNLFPVLLISKDSFISFNMAVFMISSGFVMNISKMRETSFSEFFFSKVRRLLVPMTVWFLILSVVIYPRHLDYWSAYWYLSSMFVCLVTIKILTYFLSSSFSLCVSSVIILFLIPLQCFEKICYMIPFLWIGYAWRYTIDRIGMRIVAFLTALWGVLYYFWDVRYSIYLSPFHIWEVDVNSLFSLVYRFIIGVVAGVAIILWIRIGIEYLNIRWMRKMVKYGKYTLVFYTMSFVLNALLAKIMWRVGYILSTGILDIISCVISIIMMILMYYFQKIIEKNNLLCMLAGVQYQP